jgi:predicted ribosome quality control (RQC) complex YloA/Tae2 family protein
VLLQLEPGDQPSPEGIQYAADVASFYSKARGGTKVINEHFRCYFVLCFIVEMCMTTINSVL